MEGRDSEFRERGSIFKQMGEMKKKIQLVEVLIIIKCVYVHHKIVGYNSV